MILDYFMVILVCQRAHPEWNGKTTARTGTVGGSMGHEVQCHLSEINLNLPFSSLSLGKTRKFDRKHGLQKVIEIDSWGSGRFQYNSVHVHPSKK